MRRLSCVLTLLALAWAAVCAEGCVRPNTTPPEAAAATPPARPAAPGAVSAPPTPNQTGRAVAAQSSPRIVFILDASGSMAGKVGNEEKMLAARRVLKDSIGKLPDAAEVGLIAYGHRSATDCEDIETLTPLAPLDRAALTRQIDALKPKGKTPITNALRKALDIVRAQTTGGAVTVVLVSDGLETCAGDPCRLTREAKAAGLNFVTHVIGFDVGKVSVAQLECVAQAGGGLYLGAQSADELAAALAGAVAPAEVYDSRLSIKVVVGGQLADAVVLVRRAGTREDVAGGRTYTAADTNPRLLPVPAGAYDVTVRAVDLAGGPSQQLDNVQVVDGETVEKTVDFSSGTLRVGAVRGGQLLDATVTVTNLATGKEVGLRTYTDARTNPRVFELLPGSYRVRVIAVRPAGLSPQEVNVQIKAGETVERTVNF